MVIKCKKNGKYSAQDKTLAVLSVWKVIQAWANPIGEADFYGFVRQLDAVKATLKKGDNTIVLDKDSPIAELFY